MFTLLKKSCLTIIVVLLLAFPVFALSSPLIISGGSRGPVAVITCPDVANVNVPFTCSSANSTTPKGTTITNRSWFVDGAKVSTNSTVTINGDSGTPQVDDARFITLTLIIINSAGAQNSTSKSISFVDSVPCDSNEDCPTKQICVNSNCQYPCATNLIASSSGSSIFPRITIRTGSILVPKTSLTGVPILGRTSTGSKRIVSAASCSSGSRYQVCNSSGVWTTLSCVGYVSLTTCDSDSECDPEEECSDYFDVCLPDECDSNDDCPGGFECNSDECSPEDEIDVDDDQVLCGADYSCTDNAAGCYSATDYNVCSVNSYCVSDSSGAYCVPRVDNGDDCTYGYECLSNTCENEDEGEDCEGEDDCECVGCDSDSDCLGDNVCEDEICVEEDEDDELSGSSCAGSGGVTCPPPDECGSGSSYDEDSTALYCCTGGVPTCVRTQHSGALGAPVRHTKGPCVNGQSVVTVTRVDSAPIDCSVLDLTQSTGTSCTYTEQDTACLNLNLGPQPGVAASGYGVFALIISIFILFGFYFLRNRTFFK